MSDNLNDKKNSVYSREAALERKIEIQSVTYLASPIEVKEKVQFTDTVPKFDTTIVNLGKIGKDKKVTAHYKLYNTTNLSIEIENIRVPCNCSEGVLSNQTILPGETSDIEFIFDPADYAGPVVKSIYVKLKDFPEEIRLIMISEVLP